MSYSELRYHSSPLTHLCFLVSEALSGGRHERASARPQSSAAADRAEAEARAADAAVEATSSRPPVTTSWLDRLDRWAWRQTHEEHEAYLARSTDLADLERRLRALERSASARHF